MFEASCARSSDEFIEILILNVKNTHFLVFLSQNPASSRIKFDNYTAPSEVITSAAMQMTYTPFRGKLKNVFSIYRDQVGTKFVDF